MNKPLSSLTLVCCFFALPAQAVDGIALISGDSNDAKMLGVALQWDWKKRWFTEGEWSLGGYWELDGTYWKGDGPAPEKNIYGIGFTPVLRFERAQIVGLAPYVEGGIGVHYFSDTTITGDKSMGSNFEFGDHVGLGVRFGAQSQYDVGYRYQHYSNAGATADNGGLNFNELRFRYSF